MQGLWENWDWGLVFALCKGVVIFVLGIFLALFFKKKIQIFFLKKDEILGNFIAEILFVSLIILSVITALGTLGIQTNSLVALLGTMGIAVALGLKNSLSNLASGILLIVLKPFKKDDWIEIGSTSGQVKSVNLFQTTLELPNQTQIIVPNESVAKATIINHTQSQSKKIRWELTLCSTDENLEAIYQRCFCALSSCSEVLKVPHIALQFKSINHQTYTLRMQFWIPKQAVEKEIVRDFLMYLEIPIISLEVIE